MDTVAEMPSLRGRNAANMNGNSAKFITGCSSMADALVVFGLSGANKKMSAMKGKGILATNLPNPPPLVPERPNNIGTGVCAISSNGGRIFTTNGSPHMNIYYPGADSAGLILKRTSTAVGNGSVAEFKFRANGYFAPNNNHHFAVILRGDITAQLTGKGIVFGSNVAYPSHSGVCKPTTVRNTFSFESFWEDPSTIYGDNNCVFGDITGRPILEDDVIYSVRAIVNDISKTISIGVRSSDGKVLTSQTINDPFYDLSGNEGIDSKFDFGIGTIGDTRNWTVEFGDIAYYNVK